MGSDENSNSEKISPITKGMAEQFFQQQITDKVIARAKEIAISFAHKDKSVDNATWIKNELVKYGVDEEKANNIGSEIISTIEQFTGRTKEIDNFCTTTGKTKEQWLSQFIDQNTTMDVQQKGEYLAQIDASLAVGNKVAEKIVEQSATPEVFADFQKVIETPLPTSVKPENWNVYTVATIKKDIAEQTNLMNATSLSEPVIIPDSPDITPLLPGIFDDSELGDFNLKMISTVAMKASAVADKIPFLNSLPIPALTGIVSVGAESVKNLIKVARGKMTPSETLEKTGRATVVAVADFIKSGYPAKPLALLPVIGLPLSVKVGGYLRSLSSEKIQEKIYAGIEKVKPIAKKIVTNIKNTTKKVVETAQKAVEKVLGFLGF
ncbi:MAG: hypothetical protein IJK81_04345 [Selenomonadaceae bacterium]|nr:hypothetical protein [Selenomonadaceae bacterium]